MPPLIRKSAPVAPLIAPVVIVNVPPTVVRLTTLVLLVEVRLSIVPLRVPLVRFSAAPVPFLVRSETVTVPKDAPAFAIPEEVVLPIVRPRIVALAVLAI